MFKQLRDLFRPAEEHLELSFDGLSSWLDSREEEIARDLAAATASSQDAISTTLVTLREAVARMETAETDEDAHPRLRDISRKTLPAFTRSMSQFLSREPSGDPEAFYATAAEILKGVLKAMKGQGKYLSSAYPDEVKEVRDAVRDLGREVNTMTEAIGRARERREQVEVVRGSYEAVLRIRDEYAAVSAHVRDHYTAIEELETSIRKAEEGLATLKDHPDQARKREIEETIREIKAAEAGVEREIGSLRVTALHVLRKAGKVAERSGDRAAVAAISIAVEDEDAIEAAMPSVLDMVRRGDLALKNQEEIRLFSDPETLSAAFRDAFSRKRALEKEQKVQEAALAALTVVVEEERLSAALPDLQRRREAAVAAKARAENRLEGLRAEYAQECENLRSGLNSLAGTGVSVTIPDLTSPQS
jgi:hypothetical protein